MQLFDVQLERAPDFASKETTESARSYARNTPPEDLRDLLKFYIRDYKNGAIGELVTYGLSFYIFGNKFKNNMGAIELPWNSVHSNMHSSIWPFWNAAKTEAGIAISVIHEEATARLLLEHLALLYASDQVAKSFAGIYLRNNRGMAGPGAFLEACVNELRSLHMSELVRGLNAAIHKAYRYSWREGELSHVEYPCLIHLNVFYSRCVDAKLFEALVELPNVLEAGKRRATQHALHDAAKRLRALADSPSGSSGSITGNMSNEERIGLEFPNR